MPSTTPNIANVRVRDLTGMVKKDPGMAIGSGSSADVYKATYTQPGLQKVKVALKILRSGSLTDPRLAEKLVNHLLREARVWSKLNHENVAQSFGVCYEQVEGYRIPCLVSRFYETGALKDYLQRNTPYNTRMRIFRDVLSGLAYLHNEGVVHGDIKPANILVDKRGVMMTPRAVLTDFGVSRILETSGFTTTTMRTPGTIRYMARELIDPMTIASTPRVTEESDIWSVAMTSLEIISGVVPYAGLETDSQLIYHICARSERPDRARYPGVNNSLWDMLMDCCAEERDRPKVQQMITYLNRNPQLTS